MPGLSERVTTIRARALTAGRMTAARPILPHALLQLDRNHVERNRLANRREPVAVQAVDRRAIPPRGDRRALQAAAAETAEAGLRGARRRRIGAQVPGEAAQSRRLVQIETADLTSALVGNRQHQLLLGRKRPADAV